MSTGGILVLDDPEHGLDPWVQNLKQRGYPVTVMYRSSEFLLDYEKVDPELVMLSLRLANTPELCDDLRNTPAGALVPVLLVGDGSQTINDQAQAQNIGADAYLEYPLAEEDLQDKVVTYLGDAPQWLEEANAQSQDEQDAQDDNHTAAALEAFDAEPSLAEQSQTELTAQIASLQRQEDQHTSHQTSTSSGADIELHQAEQRDAAIPESAPVHAMPPVEPSSVEPSLSQADTGAGTEHKAIIDTTVTETPPETAAPPSNMAVLPQLSPASGNAPMSSPEHWLPELVGHLSQHIGQLYQTELQKELPAFLTQLLKQHGPDLSPSTIRASLEELVQHIQNQSERELTPNLQQFCDQWLASASLAQTSFSQHGAAQRDDIQTMPELIATAWLQKWNKTLECNTPHRLIIRFTDGVPDAIQAQHPDESISVYILRRGFVARSHLDALQPAQFQGPRHLLAKLVESGALKSHEAFELAYDYTVDLIIRPFDHPQIAYRTLEPPPQELESLRLQMHPLALVLEGLRRRYNLERLTEAVGPGTTTLEVISRSTQIRLDLGLNESERKAMDALEKGQSIEDIVFREGLSAEVVYRTALAMRWAGLATFKRDTPSLNAPDDHHLVTALIDEKYKQILAADYFEIIGVSANATEYELELAYRHLERQFRPQRFSQKIRAQFATELQSIQRGIKEAYEVLRDKELRIAYAQSINPPQT